MSVDPVGDEVIMHVLGNKQLRRSIVNTQARLNYIMSVKFDRKNAIGLTNADNFDAPAALKKKW
jgi:hypothetical protein